MSECEDCGASPAPYIVFPAERIGPAKVCVDCWRRYVAEEDQ